MTAAGKEWARWGDKADRLMDYRQEIMRADWEVDRASRDDSPSGASIHVTQAIRHLRKAVRDLELLRFLIEKG